MTTRPLMLSEKEYTLLQSLLSRGLEDLAEYAGSAYAERDGHTDAELNEMNNQQVEGNDLLARLASTPAVPATYPVLALSIHHITKDDEMMLAAYAAEQEHGVLERDGDYYIRLTSPDTKPVDKTDPYLEFCDSPEARTLIRWARNHGYGMIEFSVNAPEMAPFTTFKR